MNSQSTSPLCLSPAHPSRPPCSAPLPSRRDRPGSCCRSFADRAGVAPTIEVRAGLPYHHLKSTFTDPRVEPERALRIMSEFFSRSLARCTLASLLTQLGDRRPMGRRQLAFTAMGGAYNRVAEDVTAFAHRSERFLLEHIGDAADPWVDRSWATARADGSGRGLPQLPRPRARRLGRGVPRGQLSPAWQRSRTLRPAPIL